MAQTIKLKRSSVQNNTPSTSDLQLGELAINTYDGKLFIKKDDGSASIVQVGGIIGTSELTDGSVTTTKIANNAVTTAKLANNSVGITQLNVSDGSNGQVLTTNGSGTLSFSTISSGASNQNAFSNLAVSGQSTIAADATTDTLNVVAGSGIQLTTNAGTDSLTITSTATGSVTEAFKTIAVSGQNNVVADSATDTLTFVGGSNMTITTNDSNDTITFASSGSGASGNTGGIDSQIFNGDGTDTTFTLTNAPASEDHLWIFVDGVYQNKDSYSVLGTTLTMADAPDNGTKLAVHHVRVGTPGTGAITAAMLASPLSLTGDFAVDTNVLKVDSTNNRVGINVTTPSHPLDVVGKANFTGDVDISGSIDILGNIEVGDGHLIGDDSNDNLVINSSSGESILVGSNQHIFFNTGATSLTSQGTTRMIVNSSGKVGIGTSSPSYTLHVNSTDGILIPVGTTAQRPTGAEGVFRYNSSDGKFEGYTAAGWGAIAGSGGGSSSTFLVQELTGNGSTTAFTLEKTVTSEDNLIVFNEGVFQRQDSYAAANTTITFDTAPANGNKLVVYQMETGVVGVAPKIDTMTGDGSDTTLTLSVAPASENQTIVNIDGVTQHKATYSVSGTTLTFSSPPPSGSAVECITLTNMSVTTIGDDDLDTKIHFDETADDDVIRFDTAGTERMVIGGTGKIGIGTNNPSKKLHLEDSSGYQLQLDGGNNFWNVGAGWSGYYDGSFLIANNSGDKVVIDSNGNATFNNNLTVTGNFTVNGTTTTLNSTSLTIDDKKITVAEGAGSSSAANESGIEIGVGAVGASSNPSILYYNSGTKFVVNKPLDVTGNSTATNQIATTSVYSNNGVYYGASTLALKDSSAASFLSFASNKNATFAGTAQATRVGIGVAPHATAGLNITSTAQHMRLNNGSELAIISLESGGALNIWSHGDGSNNEIKFYQGTGSGSQSMIIDPKRNVGIGTTPSTGWVNSTDFSALQIGSGLALWGRGSGDHERIGLTANIYHDGSAYKHIHTGRVTSYEQNDGKHLFKYHASQSAGASVTPTTAMTIDTSGNVGIGTSAPSEKLVVNVNSTGIKSGLILNNQYGYGSGVGVAATALQFGRDNSPSNGQTIISGQIYSGNENESTSNPCMMAFSTKSGTAPYTLTERMRISSDGNLGIGTSNPAFPLHVNTGTTDVAKFQTSNSYTFTRFASSSRNWALSVGNDFSIYDETGSSTLFLARANVNGTGAGGVFIPNGKRIGFDQTGTRSWTQYAAGGNLLFASGDGNGAIQANNFTGATLTLSSSASVAGVLTANHVIRSDAGHNTARIEAVYDDQNSTNPQYNGNMLMWVSEPGVTYDSGGIGTNVHTSGPYYGRNYNYGYSTYMRFSKSDGNIIFYQNQGTSGTGGASQTETARITANGTLRLATTGGIGFGSTAAADTLDDYEEGSWTPNWAGLGNGSASGTYTKIGNLVHITAVFTAGSTTNIGTKLEATNLPFTCVQTTYSGSRYENYQQNSYIGATRASGSQLRGYVINTSGTQATEVPVSSSQPFTWGNQDYAQLAVTYRTS